MTMAAIGGSASDAINQVVEAFVRQLAKDHGLNVAKLAETWNWLQPRQDAGILPLEVPEMAELLPEAEDVKHPIETVSAEHVWDGVAMIQWPCDIPDCGKLQLGRVYPRKEEAPNDADIRVWIEASQKLCQDCSKNRLETLCEVAEVAAPKTRQRRRTKPVPPLGVTTRLRAKAGEH
jgi:hypothetical protein